MVTGAENKKSQSGTPLIPTIYIWARRILWAAFLFGLLVLILAIAQLYELLTFINPLLARGITLLLGVLCLWALWRIYCYFRIPKAVLPPHLPPPETGWTAAQQESWQEFAVLWLKRQMMNPNLAKSHKMRVPLAIQSIRAPLVGDAANNPIAAARALTSRMEIVFNDIISPLEDEVKNLINRAAWQVSVSTAVFPNALMDAMVTLARNIDLISRIAHLYYGRPGMGATLRIVRDVFGAAIVAGLAEEVSSSIAEIVSDLTGSWSARLIGPLGQGALNGLLTIRIGNAAQRRCRSLNASDITWTVWGSSEYKKTANRLFEWAVNTAGPSASQLFKQMMPGSSTK